MTEDRVHVRNRYGVYALPPGVDHRPAVRILRAGGVYEPDTIDLIANQAGDGDIVHAGTFFGDFLPALSAALASDARLWAFEPDPANHAAARETVALNELRNVTLTQAALSARPGEVFLRRVDDRGRPLGGACEVAPEAGPGVVAVPSVTLDQAIPADRKVTVLHLDVEGHEKPALRGARRLVGRWRPVLVLERFRQPRWLSRAFPDCRYARIGRVHGNSVYTTRPLLP